MTTPFHVKKDPRRFQQEMDAAKRRLSSYDEMHSTKAARIFFSSHHDDSDGDDEEVETWRTLPRRIDDLTKYFLDKPELAETEPRSITIRRHAPMESRCIALTAAILISAPSHFFKDWKTLFSEILKLRIHNEEKNESDDDDNDEMSDDDNIEDVLGFDEEILYKNIQTLKWLDSSHSGSDILTKPFVQSLHNIISEHIKSTLLGDYEEEGYLDNLLQWKDTVLVPFLQSVLGQTCYEKEDWDRKLVDVFCQNYCLVRKTEIFDMVAEYPESVPAIKDLNLALKGTRLMTSLIAALRESFQKRLLHPGAMTNQILQMYMNTIKVLRVMDPTDSLLETVAVDIKAYLKSRSDTVRCIISSLTDEETGGDLYEELRRHDAVPLDQAQCDSDDDDDEQPDLNWKPSPSLYYQRTFGAAEVSLDMGSPKPSADILSILTNIFGSNDLFVDEYRIILADKLLANTDFDTDKEVHNLELLKLRFGENSMRQCEIMIKDMDDSKRIIANIHSTMKSKTRKDPVVQAAIVSHIFWPPLQKDQLRNHPRIQAMIDSFSLEYAKYKNPRRLVWFHQLGQVELDVDVIDEHTGDVVTKEFSCTPLQATLISHFEDNDGCWTANDLANETGVPIDVIQRKMGYWINHRVVKITQSIPEVSYGLCSIKDASLASNRDTYDEDDDGLAVSLSAQEAEEIQAYESYILGMLSNLGQLPLERIHKMLGLFVSGSELRYNKTPQQLSVFLQQLCKEDKLEYLRETGLYCAKAKE